MLNPTYTVLYPTGDERIELPLRVLETPVIPFDQSPMCSIDSREIILYFYTIVCNICQSISLEIESREYKLMGVKVELYKYVDLCGYN